MTNYSSLTKYFNYFFNFKEYSVKYSTNFIFTQELFSQILIPLLN